MKTATQAQEMKSELERHIVDHRRTYVRSFYESLTGRIGKPHELAITEIALGLASPCRNNKTWVSRRTAWSKWLRLHSIKTTTHQTRSEQ